MNPRVFRIKRRSAHCALTITALLLLAISQNAFSDGTSAIDTIPPIIEFEELPSSFAASSQVFTVQIAENNTLRDATLYYRRAGQLPFTPAPMQPVGDSGLYSTTIPTDANDLRAIEYYFQARDLGGNRTVSGYAFDPYSRAIRPGRNQNNRDFAAQNTNAEQPALDIRSHKPFYQQRWFQVGLGVVAVGLLASSMDNSSNEEKRVVPVTFTLE